MSKRTKHYIASILIALGVGGLSALLTKGNMEVYKQIIKPPLAPPSIVFPIVWGILFVLMGISAAMVYEELPRNREKVKSALWFYGLQLIVNFFWSVIFFNMQAYLFAFVWLLLLWTLIIIMIIGFKRVRPAAGYLQIPYLLWATFAGYLTLMIYLLNR